MQIQTTDGQTFFFDTTGLRLAWSFGEEAYCAGLNLLELRNQRLADPAFPLSERARREQIPHAWDKSDQDIFDWCSSYPVSVANQIERGLLGDAVSPEVVDAMQLTRVVTASIQPKGRLSAYDLAMSVVLAEALALEGKYALPIRSVVSLMTRAPGVNFAASEVAMMSVDAAPNDFVLLYDPLGPVLASTICGFLADAIFTSGHHLQATPLWTLEDGFRDGATKEAAHRFFNQFAAIDTQSIPEHHKYGTVARHLDVQQTLTRNLLRMIVGHELRHMCATHRDAPEDHKKRTEQEADVDGVGLTAHLAIKAREPLKVPYGIDFYYKAFEQLSGSRQTESSESTYPTAFERRKLNAAAVLKIEEQLDMAYETYRDVDLAIARAGDFMLTLYPFLRRQNFLRS